MENAGFSPGAPSPPAAVNLTDDANICDPLFRPLMGLSCQFEAVLKQYRSTGLPFTEESLAVYKFVMLCLSFINNKDFPAVLQKDFF